MIDFALLVLKESNVALKYFAQQRIFLLRSSQITTTKLKTFDLIEISRKRGINEMYVILLFLYISNSLNIF